VEVGEQKRALETICASEVRPVVAAMRDDPLEDRIRAAFRVAKRFWLSTDPDTQMRGALVAVLLECDPDERDRLERSCRLLAGISALMGGQPVDIAALVAQSKEEGLLPLAGMWHE
jgi:hypothetical protein